MSTLYIDIETYSSLSVNDVGPYKHSEAPDFEILMAAWAWDNDPIQLAVGHYEIGAIPGLWDPRVIITAHNAGFERICLSRFYGYPTGMYLDPRRFRDTAALAAMAGVPAGLDRAAEWLGTSTKSPDGKRLISLFCKPNRGRRIMPEERPEDWKLFGEYNVQDVQVMRELDAILPPPRAGEQRVWEVDQLINDRGIPVDHELLPLAIDAAEDNRARAGEELQDLTGVTNPNSVLQMSNWLVENGYRGENLRKATVLEEISKDYLPERTKEVLLIRADYADAATKKYEALRDRMNVDHRYRGGFRYYGAHTGRWSGQGVQLQNISREGFKDPETKEFSQAMLDDALRRLRQGVQMPVREMKALVRPMLIGPLTVCDYSAIEARITAWFAREEWMLQAFRENVDIYVAQARMAGEVLKMMFDRSGGKVQILAGGFGGGEGAFRRMGARGTTEEIMTLVQAYRRANPNIVQFWYDWMEVLREGGTIRELTVHRTRDGRAVELPSGRPLYYPRMQIDRRGKMSYQNPRTGVRTDLKVTNAVENVVQATARDLLSGALVALEDAGLRTLGHVHDEVIVEGFHFNQVRDIMRTVPAWAGDLPLDAAGYEDMRYRKD